MENNNLYNILELNKNATQYEIKKKFKMLALKYHPDKNKEKDANEKFNQIRVAYEILSDPDKKLKYDNMVDSKKKNFTDTIFLFIKEITNPKTIHNMMTRPDIMQDIKDGNINKIAQKLIQKILDNIDLDIDITQLTEIFIHSPNQSDQTKINLKQIDSTKPHTKSDSGYTIKSDEDIPDSTSDFNTLNIFGNIKTNIDDIYHNRLKEVIISRKVYQNGSYIVESNKYFIPLKNNTVHQNCVLKKRSKTLMF
jgi:curved DNA-binding protein CbpA